MALSKKAVRGSTTVIIVLLLWWLCTEAFHLFDPVLLPGPAQVLKAAKKLAFTGGLFEGGPYQSNLLGHTLTTTWRVWLGFFIASMLAIPLGLFVGAARIFEGIVDPLIQLFRPIPPIAWTPLAILWFGVDVKPIMFIIFIGSFWATLVNTIAGVKKVRPILIRAARSLGAGRFHVFWRVMIPASLPLIFTGLRLSFAAAWWAIVPAEIIAARAGLGYMIMRARENVATDDIIVGMLVISLLGFMFERLFRPMEAKIFRRYV